ncbi:hypothetical protein PAPYR_12690 [Paratrimastix pyriformis]|uniref:Uncharacterized protein n=1 Tax=Paratrimastix pyriformis TaxID=342808 RepID=A0ABQ8U5W3_9EUKA|nr:hypothetical protein PAPYR_12690 [Paratrimastix pyriformis]
MEICSEKNDDLDGDVSNFVMMHAEIKRNDDPFLRFLNRDLSEKHLRYTDLDSDFKVLTQKMLPELAKLFGYITVHKQRVVSRALLKTIVEMLGSLEREMLVSSMTDFFYQVLGSVTWHAVQSDLESISSESVRKPRPHGGGPLGAYRGSIPAGYGTGNSRTSLYTENAFCPETTPGKFLRGCTPGTRMTLHHHPDRVAPSDFENSNFKFGVCLRKPRPHGGGPLGACRGSIRAGYGTGNSRTRKFLRGCTPGTRMTLHHHPDRVATSDFENSNFEFGVWSTASITSHTTLRRSS